MFLIVPHIYNRVIWGVSPHTPVEYHAGSTLRASRLYAVCILLTQCAHAICCQDINCNITCSGLRLMLSVAKQQVVL